MDNNKPRARFLLQRFENRETGEMVNGVTVILDGQMKVMVERLHEVFPEYPDDVSLIKETVFRGISAMIEDARKAEENSEE